ncbi:hypothetical protein [Lactiplantibacillus carotarum]|nr:hypothetical protein [Lactiplantibacillus carotarum]
MTAILISNGVLVGLSCGAVNRVGDGNVKHRDGRSINVQPD